MLKSKDNSNDFDESHNIQNDNSESLDQFEIYQKEKKLEIKKIDDKS